MGLSTMRFNTPALRRRRGSVLAAALLAGGLLLGGSSSPVMAQSNSLDTLPSAPSPGAIGEQVAAALYSRGMSLFELGEVASAKKLFVESLERSPDGSRAGDALGMLRKCNEKLGIQDLEAGRPEAGGTSDTPLDPYAPTGDTDGDTPVDPYATPDGPVDPYAADPGLGDPGGGGTGGFIEPPVGQPVDNVGHATTELMISGGLVGLIAGLAITGPLEVDDAGNTGDITGAAIPVGLAIGGGGIYLGSYLAKKYDRAGGKALSSGAIWGMYNFAHIGNVFTGEGTNSNDIYRSMALGGLAGGGLAHLYVRKYTPTEGEVAVVNSGSFIGSGIGLMLAAAVDPPRGDAYSLNLTLGSMAGIGAGIYFRDDLIATSKRMTYVNLGALGGALVPWILVYPFVDGEDGGDYQTAGFLSALTMGGGAYLAWRFTKDEVPAKDSLEGPDAVATSAPALLQRSDRGQWNLGSPMPRPMYNQQLAPATGFSMGADVLSGRF